MSCDLVRTIFSYYVQAYVSGFNKKGRREKVDDLEQNADSYDSEKYDKLDATYEDLMMLKEILNLSLRGW